MLCVRGVRSRETLGLILSSCVFIFSLDVRTERPSRPAPPRIEDKGLGGALLGVGYKRVVRNSECGICFSPRLCAGDAQKGPVSPGRRKRYFFMPVSHKRRCATGDLAEGDRRGGRQHSNLQYNEWPKDSKKLCWPRELCPQ